MVDSEFQAEWSGVFDFGDMVMSFRVADVAIAAAYAIMKVEKPLEFLVSIVLSYKKSNIFQKEEAAVFLCMVKMRLAVSVCMSSYQYTLDSKNEYLLISQADAWNTLQLLDAVDSNAFTLQLQYQLDQRSPSDNAKTELGTDDYRENEALIKFRREHLSENLSLAYDSPIKIVRGQGAYLYDEKGSRYIDMVNNVCHLGHCHPKVVAAGQTQMAMLNTNTRYLHDNIADFGARIIVYVTGQFIGLYVCQFR